MCLLILDNGVGPLSTAKCHIIKILFLIKAHYYYYNNNNKKKNSKRKTGYAGKHFPGTKE